MQGNSDSCSVVPQERKGKMRINNEKLTEKTTQRAHASCAVRDRVFAYFRTHGARGLRDGLLYGERTRAYATICSAREYNIAIYFAADGKMWTYIYSKDPDGKFDRKVLREINRNPQTGATLEDCSNKRSFENNKRNVLKLHRPFDWRKLSDKEIAALLDDYNWLMDELQRIGVL